MKFLRPLTIAALAAVTLSLGPRLHAYAYSPWTTMTGEKTIAVNPFFYSTAFNPFTPTFDLVAWYGFAPNIDIAVNFATVGISGAGVSYGGSWIMPRIDLGGNNILAMQAGISSVSPTAAFFLTPQYHFFWENDNFAFEANAYLKIPLPYTTLTVGAYIAPVLKIVNKFFYLFCEVDPAFSPENGALPMSFGLGIVPGVTFLLADATHQICIGVPLGNVVSVSGSTVTAGVTPGISVWYYTTFSLAPKK